MVSLLFFLLCTLLHSSVYALQMSDRFTLGSSCNGVDGLDDTINEALAMAQNAVTVIDTLLQASDGTLYDDLRLSRIFTAAIISFGVGTRDRPPRNYALTALDRARLTSAQSTNPKCCFFQVLKDYIGNFKLVVDQLKNGVGQHDVTDSFLFCDTAGLKFVTVFIPTKLWLPNRT
jgi:hypothetical protein